MENQRKENSSKEVERVVEIGQAITLIMKGIHSTASPTVSLSDVVADSCLNLIGPYVRPSVHPSAAPSAALSLSLSLSLSFPLSHAISFMISYNRPNRRGGARALPLTFRSSPETIFVVHAPYFVQLADPRRMFIDTRAAMELTSYNSTRRDQFRQISVASG